MSTLADVTERLKKEGDLDRNSGAHSTRSLKELLVQLNDKLTVSITSSIDVMGSQFAPAIGPVDTPDDDDSSSDDTEDKREQASLYARMIDSLDGIGKGLESFSDSLLDVVGKSAKGAGIAGLLTLFISPEIAIKAFGKVIKVFNGAIDAVSGIMVGNSEGMKKFIDENPFVAMGAAFLIVIKGIGILGQIAGSISTLMVNLAKLGPMFTAISNGIGFVTSTVTLPMVATVGAISLALYSLYNGLGAALDAFEETGSIVEALKALSVNFVGTLIGLPVEFAKKALSFLAGMFGFDAVEAALDSVDLQAVITEGLDGLLTSVVQSFTDMLTYLSAIPSKIVSVIKGGLASVLPDWAAEKLGLKDSPTAVSDSVVSVDESGKVTARVMTKSGEMQLGSEEIRQGIVSRKIPNKEGTDALHAVVKKENELGGQRAVVKTQKNSDGVWTAKVMTDRGMEERTADEIREMMRYKEIKREDGTAALHAIYKKDSTSSQTNFGGDTRHSRFIKNESYERQEGRDASLGIQPAANTSVSTNLDIQPSANTSVSTNLRSAQAENNALSSNQSSSVVESLAPMIAAVGAGGGSGGGSTNNTAVANTTNVTNNVVPDNISREWVYRPA